MPTLRALECLVAVLDAGSITEAAAALHMSQPALSHQLAALEREIGAPVLERLPRGVRATVVGRAVAADARAALEAAQRVVSTGRATARGAAGHLRVACAESMTAGLLAPVLRTWLRRNPLVGLGLTEASSADELARLVESGAADVAIGPRPTRWTGGAEVIGVEEIVAVLPPGHPLAERKRVGFEQLRDEPLVHYHPDNGLAGWLDAEAARQGVSLTASVRTRQAVTAARLAAAGVGIALVPTTALGGGSAAIRRLRPGVERDLVCLIGIPGDVLVSRFVAEVARRGVPVPAIVAAALE
ncbi:LysR family transcriptional regulator [Nocardia seriolae]|uniref:HTH-type transcriptional regulator LtrA n=1 Tax=Nocardia seriolae TaxID=37332 RepID=A0A0B8NLW2_9NOCA|nr:LysR family transcriptional regulator [Nocardia seriolae]APB00091.1 putative HTH-type transcriptional regulator LtrA [Nocardia seriolae]MTJ64764.1 LysR family transcriptional regulator [Nocardia seriolae]MTJ74189.1 LysR family transcriptional regulator [Nocardia seriolae]MTJ89604.1 LysR family transcriptional regulator [Nocardia seriolae]MTK33578.1 LysR family transcriptional regulator [Nocardia seriolae]